MLADASSLLEGRRLKSAADRAYYAMFHAAQAGLVVTGNKPARTHRGLRVQFGQHLVSTHRIEKSYGKDLAMAQDVRRQSTYEAFAVLTEDSVADLIRRADNFCRRVRALASGGTA